MLILLYDKVRANRKGIRSWEVSYRQGQWRYQTAEAARLEILAEYLSRNPQASTRTIAKEIGPQLGSRSPESVRQLKEKLEGIEADDRFISPDSAPKQSRGKKAA